MSNDVVVNSVATRPRHALAEKITNCSTRAVIGQITVVYCAWERKTNTNKTYFSMYWFTYAEISGSEHHVANVLWKCCTVGSGFTAFSRVLPISNVVSAYHTLFKQFNLLPRAFPYVAEKGNRKSPGNEVVNSFMNLLSKNHDFQKSLKFLFCFVNKPSPRIIWESAQAALS